MEVADSVSFTSLKLLKQDAHAFQIALFVNYFVVETEIKKDHLTHSP